MYLIAITLRMITKDKSEQGTFTTAAGAHDDKNITALNVKIEVLLDDTAPIGHGQVANFNTGVSGHSHPQLVVDNIERGVGNNQVNNRTHYRRCGGLAHGC